MQELQRQAFTLSEVAGMLGVNQSTAWRKVAAGELKKIVGAGNIRISRAEFERYLSQTTAHVPEPINHPGNKYGRLGKAGAARRAKAQQAAKESLKTKEEQEATVA